MPGGMPSGMPDFSGGSFTPPDGAGTEGFTPPSEFSGTNPFGGSSGESSQPAVTDQAAPQPTDTAAAPSPEAAGSAEKPEQSGERSGPPGGFPGGGDFPGMQQTDQTALWIQVALCAAGLLAVLLIVRRTSSHNN